MSQISQAWEQHPGRNLDGALAITVRGGATVTIGHIEDGPDGTVLVWTGPKQGRPQMRIAGIPQTGDPIAHIAGMLAGDSGGAR